MNPYIYITIPSYGLMATIGLIVSMLFCYFRLEKIQLSFRKYMIYFVGGMIFLLLGSKIMFAFAMLPSMETFSFYKFFSYLLNGGIVFYGGMLGFLFGIFLVSKINKDNSLTVLNFFAPAIPLFHIFARFGCFLSGCCYGVRFFWGYSMLHSPDIVRFPVQLIECICNFIIFIIILILNKKNKSQYSLKIYLILYSCCRFVLEFFRGDVERGIWFDCLSTAQIVSLVILIVLLYIKVKSIIKIKHIR